MKFTEEQAREALRSELTNKGRKSLAMSDRTLASQTEKLINVFAKLKEVESIDEMGLPDFVGIAVEILGDTNDNVRKDNSDFVRNWKKDHPDTDPTNPTNPADPEPPKPTEDPALKAYEERIAALEKRLAEADTKSVLAQKRADLTAKLKEKGVKDEKWLDKYLSKVNINADTDVDAEVEDTLSLYNLNKANGGNPVPPANPNGGNPNINDDMSDVLALAKQRNETMKM